MLFDSDPVRVDELVEHLVAQPGRTSIPALPLDAYRRGDDVWIHVDLPGVSPEAIGVTVIGDRVEIVATRSPLHRPDDRIYASERPTGTASRTVQLGAGLDVDALVADHRDGVLTLRVPVAVAARRRTIPIAPDRSGAIDVESTVVETTEVDFD